jgi:hypothetical protein
MATRYYTGAAKSVAQVNTVTPANVNIGNTFTVTCNGKSITYTATAATVANVTAGLVAKIKESEEPEFLEVTAEDITTAITLTARTPGKPFTITSSASGGTATLTTVVTTANSGPEQYDLAANWSGGVLPANNDTVIIEGGVNLRYGTLAGVTLARLIVRDFFGQIGLPPVNADGGYPEYRQQYMLISATNVDLMENVTSGLMRLNVGSVQTTVTVYGTGSPASSVIKAFTFLGTHANNVLHHLGGSVGVATEAGEAATLSSWKTGSGAAGGTLELELGLGCTLGVGTQSGGDVTIYADMSGALNIYGGTNTLMDDADISGQVNVYSGGTLVINGTPTLNGVEVFGGTVDASRDTRPFTITNDVVLHRGSTWDDRFRRGTYNGNVGPKGCDWADVTARFGPGRTWTVA